MKRLKLERILRGWSQGDLAARAYVSKISILRFERARQYPKPDVLESLAAALEWQWDPAKLMEDVKRGDVI